MSNSNYQKAVRRRVLAGVAWLNEQRPGWFWQIDPESFDITDSTRCVLGQVYEVDAATAGGGSGYSYAYYRLLVPETLGFLVDFKLANRYGVYDGDAIWRTDDYDQVVAVYNTTWLREITKLRLADSKGKTP